MAGEFGGHTCRSPVISTLFPDTPKIDLLPEWTALSGAVYAQGVRVATFEFQKLVESGTSSLRNVFRPDELGICLSVPTFVAACRSGARHCALSAISWPLIRVRLFHSRASFPAEFFVSRIGGHSCDEMAADFHREIGDPAIASKL